VFKRLKIYPNNALEKPSAVEHCSCSKGTWTACSRWYWNCELLSGITVLLFSSFLTGLPTGRFPVLWALMNFR